MRSPLVALLAVAPLALAACNDPISPVDPPAPSEPAGPCDLYAPVEEPDLTAYHDPGVGEWESVARADLIAECGLDPDLLDGIDAATEFPYAIVRYGKLCHEHYPAEFPGPDDTTETASATKTLAATVVGRTATLSAELDEPLCDTDRMSDWVDRITFNRKARVAHVLAMLGYNDSLAYGERVYEYDATGARELDRLGDVIEAVIAQDPSAFSGATTTEDLAQRELFDRLGMSSSTWEGRIFGFGWRATLRDMARLGLLLVHDGVWASERLVHEEWVYRMTHPAFEDANTAYGYLTSLAASEGYYILDFPDPMKQPLGACEPPALWPSYPHSLSESPDCGYDDHSCAQTHDVGVFAAVGYGGQFIVGHPGLDLVVVTKNAGLFTFPNAAWDMIRPAVVAHDPVYGGDDAAFCAAYAAGEYAPDLVTP